MKHPDVVVIGGGIVGCAVTYWLARAGLSTLLVERDGIAGGSSGSCMGHLMMMPDPADMYRLSHRSVEDLLTHILDPNMSINPNYVACVVETVDGRIVNGLLQAETADSITIMQAEAKTFTIERDEIEQFRTLRTSLMPEGLEKELNREDLADVMAFVKSIGK